MEEGRESHFHRCKQNCSTSDEREGSSWLSLSRHLTGPRPAPTSPCARRWGLTASRPHPQSPQRVLRTRPFKRRSLRDRTPEPRPRQGRDLTWLVLDVGLGATLGGDLGDVHLLALNLNLRRKLQKHTLRGEHARPRPLLSHPCLQGQVSSLPLSPWLVCSRSGSPSQVLPACSQTKPVSTRISALSRQPPDRFPPLFWVPTTPRALPQTGPPTPRPEVSDCNVLACLLPVLSQASPLWLTAQILPTYQ